METKTYSHEQIRTAEDTAKLLSAMPKDEQNTAVALVNAFIAGMEAQKLAAGAKSA